MSRTGLTRLGPEQPHRKAGLGWMGHLCCFVRDEGLGQGTNHSGSSSDSSTWQEHSGWGCFSDIGTLGSTPNPSYHTIKGHQPGKAGQCLSRGAALASWPCPGHPHQQLPRWVSSQHAAGQEEGGGGQRLRTGGGSLGAPPFFGPPGKPGSGQGGQRAGCLYLAGQPEPRLRVAKGRVAETKPR